MCDTMAKAYGLLNKLHHPICFQPKKNPFILPIHVSFAAHCANNACVKKNVRKIIGQPCKYIRGEYE